MHWRGSCGLVVAGSAAATICGGSGSAERMRIVPRPRQVGHWEDMGLLGGVDGDRAACTTALHPHSSIAHKSCSLGYGHSRLCDQGVGSTG